MNNIIIKLVVEKPEVVVDLKVDRPSIKYSELVNNMFKGEMGLQGERGEQGNGIESIVKSSSDGLVDIYTILFTNGETQTFNITNGANGKDGLNGKDGADGKDATIVGLTVNVDNTTGTPRATATMGGTPNERTFVINFSGLKGEQGKDGVIGRDGKSAYDYALEGGYIGSEQDFSKELSDIATKEFVEENSSNFITKNSKDLTNYTLTTETGSKLNLSINNDYLMTLQLLDKNGNVIDTKTLDFPIESMVVNASYSNGIITLVLQNGTELPINVSALVKGLVPDTRKINGKELNQDINLNAEDVGVPEWARENTKPKYDYSEIENTPNIPQGSTVDTELSTTSTNAVQNKVVTSAINNISSNLETTTNKVNNNEETISAISQNMNLLNINKANKDASNLDEISAIAWREKLQLGLPLGLIIPSAIVQNDAGLRLLDGSSLSLNGVYKAFCDYLVERYLEDNTSVPVCSIEEYANDMNNYGQCGKFVYNNTSSELISSLANTTYSVPAYSIKLPTITKHIEGISSISELGTALGAGLPNIEGSVNSKSGIAPVFVPGTEASGAFAINNTSSDTYHNTGKSNDTRPMALTFDASKSNSIYGNSNTVQTQSVKYPYYIVVATTAKTDIEVNIDNIASDLNNVLSQINTKISKNEIARYPVSTWVSSDKLSWYIIYNDNFKECGGYVPANTSGNSTNKLVTFPLPSENGFTEAPVVIGSKIATSAYSMSSSTANNDTIANRSFQLNRLSTTGFYLAYVSTGFYTKWKAEGY